MSAPVEFDLLIIGGGAAGLTAALYGARYGLKTAVLEEKVAGGLTATAPIIENYPAFKQINGMELMDLMREQVEGFGAEIIEITKIIDIIIEGKMKIKTIAESGDEFYGKACILSTGSDYKKLNVPGEKDLLGQGVSYCSTCDGAFFKNKKVAVIGGGNNACISARYLNSNLNAQVALVHRRNDLRGEKFLTDDIKNDSKIEKYWNSVIEEIKGQNKVETLVLRNLKTQKTQEVPLDGVFINIGEIPNNDLAKKLNLELDEDGYVVVNRKFETNVEGIFAAGDITGGVLQTIVSAGEGAAAAVSAYLYIQGGWYKQAKGSDLV